MKYNYESWLKGEIKNDLVVLMELKKEISREDFKKIREKQRWTFDQVVKYSLEHYKGIFELQKRNKPKIFVSAEIEITGDEINKDKNIKRQVLSGEKNTYSITGKQYLKVKKEVERCEKARKENKQAGFDFYLNENAGITVLYKYLQYLKRPKKHIPEDLHLINILDDIKYWQYLKETLAGKYVDINTGIVIDEKKGYITFFITLVKHLHSKGYYKDKIKPTNKEIVIILKNTFGIKTEENTCKQIQGTNFLKDPGNPSIKYASEIP